MKMTHGMTTIHSAFSRQSTGIDAERRRANRRTAMISTTTVRASSIDCVIRCSSARAHSDASHSASAVTDAYVARS
jgi:hypothetical protein